MISTICKHIVAKEALTGGGKGVRVQEPLDDGVVVAGLEVIPASVFGMAVISERVLHGKWV